MMGAGGVGGYFGGRMAAGGCDVTFVARGRHLEALRKNGLKIDSRDLGDAIIDPANVTADPQEVGVVDCVIVAVKLWDTEAVGRAILPMIGPQTTVLSLQNGVDACACRRRRALDRRRCFYREFNRGAGRHKTYRHDATRCRR